MVQGRARKSELTLLLMRVLNKYGNNRDIQEWLEESKVTSYPPAALADTSLWEGMESMELDVLKQQFMLKLIALLHVVQVLLTQGLTGQP